MHIASVDAVRGKFLAGQFLTCLYSRLNPAVNPRTGALLTERFIFLVGWCSGWLSLWRATDRGTGAQHISQGPSQALTILAKLLAEFTRSEGFWSLCYHHQAFPFLPPHLMTQAGLRLSPLVTDPHLTSPLSLRAARRSCGPQPQLNNQSPHLNTAHALLQPTRQSLFWRVCKLKNFGNWLASINSVWGEHQLATSCFSSLLWRVWDLKGKLYKASSFKHCLAPFYTLGMCQLKWWLNLSNTMPSLHRSETLSKNDRLSTSPRMPTFV